MQPAVKTLGPGKGKIISVVGDVYTCKVRGEDTAGACCVFEFLVPPGGGPPLHTHTREDESFYILEGELTFTVRDKQITAPAGSFVYAPKGIPHRFANTSGAPVRAIVTCYPAGMEKFFDEVGTPLTKADDPVPAVMPEDIAKLLEAAPRYGITLHA